MKLRIPKKLLAGCLSVVLMLQFGDIATVFAAEDANAANFGVICTGHPIHDAGCGYAAGSDAIEGAPESPCNHNCNLCTERDSGSPPLMQPSPLPFGGSDVTDILENVSFTVTQDGREIAVGGKLNPTDTISIAVSFNVPDGLINEGDTASFQLSAGLDIGEAIDGPLYFLGEKVGDIKFSLDQTTAVTTATVTFAAIVDEIGTTDIKVNFTADMSYNGSGDGGNAGEHTVQILEKDFTVVVPEKVTTITVTKSGTANVAGKVVDWVVKVDPVLEGGTAGSLGSCTFTDNLTDVGDYVANSFKIGTLADGMDATAVAPSKIAPALTYDFSAADSGTKYIFFQTDIPQDKLDGDGKQTINNTAGVTTTRTGVIIKDGSGKVEFEIKWIEKSGKANNEEDGSGIYDPQNQTITWSITANHDGASLSNVVITDKLPGGLTFKSAYWQKWDNAIGSTGGWSTMQTPTTPVGNEYRLGTIDTKILLTIIAKVVDTNPPSGITNYKNTATIKWDGLTGDGYGATSGNVGIGFAPIKKEAKGYNQSKHEIDWNVGIDAQGQSYGDKLRIMDLLVYGESGFNVKDTYTISDNSKGNLFDVIDAEIKQLTPRYNQKYVTGSFNDTTISSALDIVVHTLTNANGKAVADLLVVTSADGISGISNTAQNSFSYKSVVTNPAIYASNKTDYQIQNTASLFSSNSKISDAAATQKCTSKMLEKDILSPAGGASLELTPADASAVNRKGESGKEFNYVDKSIYFRIHVNANGLTNATNDITTVNGEKLGDLLVTDTLPVGWKFEQIGGKDFLLFAGTKSATAGLVTATQKVSEGDYASIFTGGIPTLPTETVGSKIDFKFTSLDKPYVIVVKAGPTSETAADYFSTNNTHTGIRNNAFIYTGVTELARDYEDFSITSSLVKKTLDQTIANSDGYLIWNVEYKPYGLAHIDAYLEDTLPAGIDLRTNSKAELLIENNITATTLVLGQDGNYTDGAALDTAALKAAISYNSQTRGIHFQIPDTSKAYRLTYITDITGPTGTVQNKVSLMGGAIPPTGADDQKNYSITSASSGASFKRSGWLLVTKQNADGTPLAGAEFTLFAEDGTTIIRQGTSAGDGKIYLKVLPEGDYILKETAAPSGYVLDGQRHIVTIAKDTDGKFVASIDGQTSDSSNEITVKNHKTGTVGALTIDKTVRGNAGDTARAC